MEFKMYLVDFNLGNIHVTQTYSFAHKNIVKATQKGSEILVDLIDKIHETSLHIEEKRMNPQDNIFKKWLDYFKCKDKLINETQMKMVKAIACLTQVMSMVLKTKGLQIRITQTF
jgi:hypothetical protein